VSTTIDLDRAEEIFAAATDFTVGLEEEFSILDPVTLEMAPRFDELRDAALASDPVLGEHITGELISSEIEIISGPGADLHDALRRQRERRRALFALAASRDAALGASGTHPWADYRTQAVIDTPHYHRVEDGLKYVAWRNNTFSLHVHVGIRDADRAVRVCDRMRPLLPLLLAVSANSPFLDGRLAGLHSARTQTFTRSFPRCGVPFAFGGWQPFRDYIDLLIATNSIIEFTQVWWSVRPHFSYGTVEVRICDVQPTAAESDALSALIVACVAQAALEVDGGEPHEPLPGYLIEENMWRAIRNGLDGQMIDFDRGVEYPSSEIVERLLEWTAPARAGLGLDAVAWPAGLNGSQRQRAMVQDGASMRETFAGLVGETRATYSEEVRA
jgi:glutamate---cysteine ligase / carboxylate-amine ligase